MKRFYQYPVLFVLCFLFLQKIDKVGFYTNFFKVIGDIERRNSTTLNQVTEQASEYQAIPNLAFSISKHAILTNSQFAKQILEFISFQYFQFISGNTSLAPPTKF